MEAYEGTPLPRWSCGPDPVVRVYKFIEVLKEGFREVLRRVHGSGRL